jgi:hypothetical protein
VRKNFWAHHFSSLPLIYVAVSLEIESSGAGSGSFRSDALSKSPNMKIENLLLITANALLNFLSYMCFLARPIRLRQSSSIVFACVHQRYPHVSVGFSMMYSIEIFGGFIVTAVGLFSRRNTSCICSFIMTAVSKFGGRDLSTLGFGPPTPQTPTLNLKP